MRRPGSIQSFKTCVFCFWAFVMKATPARQVTPPWDVYMANCHPSWQGYPTWQTRQPTEMGHPTYHVYVIKIKKEIIWTGRLPHLGGLPHLPRVPHPHVNRPKESQCHPRAERIQFAANNPCSWTPKICQWKWNLLNLTPFNGKYLNMENWCRKRRGESGGYRIMCMFRTNTFEWL